MMKDKVIHREYNVSVINLTHLQIIAIKSNTKEKIYLLFLDLYDLY